MLATPAGQLIGTKVTACEGARVRIGRLLGAALTVAVMASGLVQIGARPAAACSCAIGGRARGLR
jgi:hypothetical protein